MKTAALFLLLAVAALARDVRFPDYRLSLVLADDAAWESMGDLVSPENGVAIYTFKTADPVRRLIVSFAKNPDGPDDLTTFALGFRAGLVRQGKRVL